MGHARHGVAQRPTQVVPFEGPGDERGGESGEGGAQQHPFHGLAGAQPVHGLTISWSPT
jgi:hypothetical protein